VFNVAATLNCQAAATATILLLAPSLASLAVYLQFFLLFLIPGIIQLLTETIFQPILIKLNKYFIKLKFVLIIFIFAI
jgi:hypothetical protein